MQDRYWMFQRNGVFYLQDKVNGKQKSLKTRDAAAARRMLAGKNQAALSHPANPLSHFSLWR